MKKALQLLLSISCLFFVIVACGLFGGKDKELSFKNPVYANVYFEETRPNSAAPVQGLIAINYDDPKDFKLLASDSAAYNNVRISQNGEKLIYTDKYVTGLGSNPQYSLYNTITGKKELLYDEGPQDVPLFGHENIRVAWNKSSDGFYYTNPEQPFSGHKAVWYYDLEDRKTTILKENQPYAIYPYDLISSDTLIIFSNEFGALEYYLMDLNGEYLRKIKNPFIDGVNEEGITKRGIFDLAWNDSLRLITAGYINGAEFEGYKIIVTDLEGTTFKEFTNGIYLNSNPTWTKDGKIIYTERRNSFNRQIESELKIIDIEAGSISSFFSRKEYPEITGIGTSDQ